jgi:hypothetical protein
MTVASTSVSMTVAASPTRAWELVGGFGSLPDWLPFITRSTLVEGGRVRQLQTVDGEAITERLVAFSDAERSYSYGIVVAPFPIVDYIATLRVHSVSGRDGIAEVQWSARFTPSAAATDQEVVELFTGIFRDGLDALNQTLA